jgi:hypothetical protein
MNKPREFPGRVRVWQASVTAIAIVSFFCLMWLTYETQWTFEEKLYVPAYVKTWWRGLLPNSHSEHELLYVVNTKGEWRLGSDGEIKPVTLANGTKTFALTKHARSEGLVKLELDDEVYNDQKLHAFLGHYIFGDQTLWDIVSYPAYGALIILFAGLFVAIPKDAARARVRREGRVISGPELVTIAEFNRRMKSDGVGFDHVQRGWFKRLCGKKVAQLRIPQDTEKLHFMVMGDTGAGKSAIMRQLLLQIRDRGEGAVIYDPAMGYLPHFYDPARGDVILNPLDARSPFWSPGSEIVNEAEALTVATSMFPEESEHHQFFVKAVRQIFAHLIGLKPTPQELIEWMCNVKEIDRRVKGTEMEAMVDPHGGPQRAGVLGSLNMVGNALRLLPKEADTTQRWSAVEWAKRRKGWIFITSQATVQDRLQPVVSTWLDLLMLRLMNEGHTNKSPVWFVLDEVADLKHLPQLPKAMTQNRKSNNPMVLGFQGKDQIETFYGKMGKTMLSQPNTRIYLKTGEPDAAEWIEKALGQVYIERLRETISTGPDGQRTISETIDPPRPEPLVPYSRITGLSRLQGFLKHDNLVVELNTRFLNLEERHERIIERPPNPPSADVAVNNSGPDEPVIDQQNGRGVFFE